MKKFFSYLGWILLLAVVVAAFTATGKEQCKKYVSEKLPPNSFINLTVHEAPFKIWGAQLFSTYTVSYYKPTQISLAQDTNASSYTKAAVAAVNANSGVQTATYIGMYNTFWKW